MAKLASIAQRVLFHGTKFKYVSHVEIIVQFANHNSHVRNANLAFMSTIKANNALKYVAMGFQPQLNVMMEMPLVVMDAHQLAKLKTDTLASNNLEEQKVYARGKV